MVLLTNEKNIESLAISYELYSRLLQYSWDKGLISSSYNHGKGVDRKYTIKFCLQETRKNVSKYYLKRGGRPPSQYSGLTTKNVETLEAETPDFDTLCRNIAKKYSSEVIFVNRYENGFHYDHVYTLHSPKSG